VGEITPPSSPDSLQLRGAPVSSARLSRKAAFGAIAVLAVILGVIVINASKGGAHKKVSDVDVKKELEPAVSAGKSLTQDVPDVITEPPPLRAPPAAVPKLPNAAAPLRSAEEDARLADTAVSKFVASQSTRTPSAVAGWSGETAPDTQDTVPNPAIPTNGNDTGLENPLRGGSPVPGAAEAGPPNGPDLNRQDEKLSFLQQARHSAYLNSRLTAPRSPFELKTGTVIPAILVGAMNSDLPGEILAQVSQNVYNSASGEYLLIPQGTRLYGHYDSNVSFGQNRLLVRWQRLIYPNAYTLELQGMAGGDQGGSAGFADRVNNHYGRIFGWALVTSVLSAGFQLSQPQQGSVLSTPASGQVAAAAVGQQMAQLGASLAQRNMQVQPTIQIRKGYRFNVMVNKDIIFPGSYAP
jgi:type IV secretion system protein VirB10